MSIGIKRGMALGIYLFLLLIGPYTILSSNGWVLLSSDIVYLSNLFQRLSGLTLFSLLFIQLTLGSFMLKWTDILGAKAYSWHIVQGIIIYLLILLHPLFQSIIDFKIGGLTYSLVQILPHYDTQSHIYMVYGKIAFVLFTIGVIAGYFRTNPFFRKNWLYFHYLNYIAFFFVAYHAYKIGSDITAPPFVWFYWLAIIVVAIEVLYKLFGSYLINWFKMHEIRNNLPSS